MAIPTSPTRAIFQPTLGKNHERRGSTRKSFTSLAIPAIPQIESPRTLCPRDGDAFSYNPAHLPAWYISQDLWERLTPQLQSTVASMQHAGAAVLTGFERLDKHDDDLAPLEDLLSSKLRTMSDASSSALFSDTSLPALTNSPNSESPSPPFPSSQVVSPISPICLEPLEKELSDKRARSREHSFSVPLEPHDAYYAAELSHLRTEALPRLRHTVRKLEGAWIEAKRAGSFSIADVNAFENWLAEKKCRVLHFDDQAKRRSHDFGLSSNGMGWMAP